MGRLGRHMHFHCWSLIGFVRLFSQLSTIVHVFGEVDSFQINPVETDPLGDVTVVEDNTINTGVKSGIQTGGGQQAPSNPNWNKLCFKFI